MTQHAESQLSPDSYRRRDRLGIAMMVVGLLVFVGFAAVIVMDNTAKWSVPVLLTGWMVWFAGKSIRKRLSTRQQEEYHLRRAEEAKRNEAANAATRDREHST